MNLGAEGKQAHFKVGLFGSDRGLSRSGLRSPVPGPARSAIWSSVRRGARSGPRSGVIRPIGMNSCLLVDESTSYGQRPGGLFQPASAGVGNSRAIDRAADEGGIRIYPLTNETKGDPPGRPTAVYRPPVVASAAPVFGLRSSVNAGGERSEKIRRNQAWIIPRLKPGSGGRQAHFKVG